MGAFLQFAFLQRALAAGLLIAVACAVLGVFLILRKDAMIGHGLSHITFAGVALGLLLGRAPLLVAVVFSVLASLALLALRSRTGLPGDTAIAILSSAGLALGIVLAALARTYNAGLLAYLFGEVLAIRAWEVGLAAALALLVGGLVVAFFHPFTFMTFDRDSARVAGVPVARLDALLTVMTSLTIVLGMRVVGVLLVSALVVIPAAAALQVATSFKRAVFWSCGLSAASVVLGLAAAVQFDLPASGTIVLASVVLFTVLFAVRRTRR